MTRNNHGTLIVIGGHEDKEHSKTILHELVRRIGSGKLVVTTVASEQPDGLYEDYQRVFRNLGVKHLAKLEISSREEARSPAKLRTLQGAAGLFFTGGDQLRITSQIGDTPIFHRVAELFAEGGIVAGTSAGASVLCETMLVSGAGSESPRLGAMAQMAPGLGLITGLIIDQHFAERGRMGRLLGAVAQNPRSLGVGIDENTAVIVEEAKRFFVLGSGAVYVVDGSTVTASNLAEDDPERILSVYDVRLHVLSQGDSFDLCDRKPGKLSRHTAEQVFGKAMAVADMDGHA